MAFYPRYHHKLNTDTEFANFVSTNINSDVEFVNDMDAMDIQYLQIRYQFVIQLWDCYDQIRTLGKTELIPIFKECCRCAVGPLRKDPSVAHPLIESYVDAKFGA